MRHLLRRTLTVALASTMTIVGAGLVTVATGALTATPSGASTTPPWEPDSNSVGALVFYDASGNVITGGSVNSAPIAAYVGGTATVRSGDTKATLFGYLPVNGEAPGQWSGEALGASTLYPVSSAPSAVAALTTPVETGGVTDLSVADLESDYPNTDTSTTDGYAHVYVLRLRTSHPGSGLTTTYDSVDILVSGNSWSVEYPASSLTATTTSLATSPVGSTTYGHAVTLTATVTPSAAAGSVQFFDGSTSLGTASVASGQAQVTTSALSVGSHSLTADFSPTDTTTYATSTSSTATLTVTTDPTSTTLSVPSTSSYGANVVLGASVTPSSVSGLVKFYAGSAIVGQATLSGGKASVTTNNLPGGTTALHAVFVPTSSTVASSTSSIVKIAVAAAHTKVVLTSSKSSVVKGASLTLAAALTPTKAAGLVQFFDGTKKLATVHVTGGRASDALTTLTVGAHSLKAVFLPTNGADFTSSTSKVVKVTVKK